MPQTLTCANCQKQFLVIDQEIQFLATKNLSQPTQCPSCRQARRLKLRGEERQLYKTKCQKCGQEIVVAYDQTKVQNQILCKKDYDQWFMDNDPIIKDPLPEV